MSLSVAERIAQIAEHFASDDRHGYSQPNRGTGGTEAVELSDGSRVTISDSDVDCSEMVRQCVDAALTGGIKSPISYMWTGSQDAQLLEVGFVRVPFDASIVRRGDVLWVTGHTGVALGGGLQADAHGDERGGITGPRRGDQTPHEGETRSLRSTWACIYRYKGSEPWLVPDEDPEEKAGDMSCIISVRGRNTSLWFDGAYINDLTSPEDIAVLDKLAGATIGGPLPRVELTEDEFARLCQAVKGGYPKHLKSLVNKYPARSPEE